MDPDRDARELFDELDGSARKSGYNLNPDREFTMELVEGLLINTRRYGYQSCPCRLAAGSREQDLDIICPCDYRDPDLAEYGACYCGLYVSDRVVKGEKELGPVPERRPAEPSERGAAVREEVIPAGTLAYPVFRCRVCGYLCARDQPPGRCPVCGVSGDRFEEFILK